jgi:Flp pilus assembly protein TadG
VVAWIRRLVNMGKERRHSHRKPNPAVGAYFFDGGASTLCRLSNISEDGAYIETSWPWAPGTLMRLTLNKAASQLSNDGTGDASKSILPVAPAITALRDAIVVHAEVVRTMKDGMGVHFQFPTFEERRDFLTFLASATRNKPALPAREQGQSLIEFSLIFPLLFLLIVNVVNFGSFMYAWITVASAAREGAQYMITGGATVFGPSTPSSTFVSNLVTADVSSLPNRGSLVVHWCTNNNGTILPSGSTLCPSADVEAPNYTLGVVDVTYTYQPMIALWTFPGNIHATMPPTTIHRQTIMRVLN